jgi:hypothetical protein
MEQAPIWPRMAGVMPETTIDYEYEDIIDLTGGQQSFFKSRILSTTGIIISIVLICIIMASIIIIKRR